MAIIQARTAASRLPGKVLMDIAGEPMLVRVVKRTQRALTVGKVLVATTDDPTDYTIEELCKQRGYACYRGSNYGQCSDENFSHDDALSLYRFPDGVCKNLIFAMR